MTYLSEIVKGKRLLTAVLTPTFKKEYDVCLAQMEKDYEKSVDEIKARHQKEFEDFKSELENQTDNYKNFNTLMDKLLLGG